MYNNTVPPVTIARKAIKHLYLRLDAHGNLRVSAPLSMSDEVIFAFIAEKRDWIARKQRQMREKQRETARHQSADNPDKPSTFTLFGEDYPIHYRQGRRHAVELIDGVCEISLKSSQQSSNAPSHSVCEKLLREFHRAQLLPVLHRFVEHYQPIIGVTVAEIRTKQMKTKWGTCNIRDRRLWFNVQLARFPVASIEYVVVHEMTHLLERYHNRRFYALVEKALPDWQRHDDALRTSV